MKFGALPEGAGYRRIDSPTVLWVKSAHQADPKLTPRTVRGVVQDWGLAKEVGGNGFDVVHHNTDVVPV